VLVTFPPERVMSALAPMDEPSPTLQPGEPEPDVASVGKTKVRLRRQPRAEAS
jgi:two-component system cell cycle sensor histidine kinase PleC